MSNAIKGQLIEFVTRGNDLKKKKISALSIRTLFSTCHVEKINIHMKLQNKTKTLDKLNEFVNSRYVEIRFNMIAVYVLRPCGKYHITVEVER